MFHALYTSARAPAGGCNLAVAAGIAVLEELEDQELSLIPKAEQNGQTLLENLKKMEEVSLFLSSLH